MNDHSSESILNTPVDENNNTIDTTQLNPIQETQNTAKPKEKKPKKYIVLPYSNRKADKFAQELKQLVEKNFEVDLRVAFKAPNEIGKMFPFKDNIKKTELKSLVVYKIKCETCNEFYIGKCKRILQHRIKEHNDPKQKTAISTHKMEYPDHVIDANNIEIIDRADTNFKLMLKEMLHINKQKPSLNTQHAAAYKNKTGKDMFKLQLKTIIIASKR